MPKPRKITYPGTLTGVMQWAFAGHRDKSPTTKLNIAKLLSRRHKNPRQAVALLNKQLRKPLSAKDSKILAEMLKGGQRTGVKIYTRDVLAFMNDLFHRGTKIPPPWRT